MRKKKAAGTPSDKTDSYLKTQHVGTWIYVLAGVILLSGAVIWLFFGSISCTVNGYAQVTGGYYADCIVPASRIDEVKIGQTVWIGGSSGPITSIKPNYVTYEEVAKIYGYSADKLHLNRDETYYYVRADIRDEKTGYHQYTIIVDTTSPFDRYFGGDAK